MRGADPRRRAFAGQGEVGYGPPMMKVGSTIRRKGKVIARAVLTVEEGQDSAAAIRAVAEETSRQAKAHDIARHTSRSGYRKPKAG